MSKITRLVTFLKRKIKNEIIRIEKLLYFWYFDFDLYFDTLIYQRPKEGDQTATADVGSVPTLAPPPKSPQVVAYTDSSPRFNPFDKSGIAQDAVISETAQIAEMARTDSQVLVLIS